MNLRTRAGRLAYWGLLHLPANPVAKITNIMPSPLTTWQDETGVWWVDSLDSKYGPIAMTKPGDVARYLIGSSGFDSHIERKARLYQSEKAGVVVEPSDRVVDVGGFLGEVSLTFSQQACEVVIVEPDPRSYAALKRTFADNETVDILNRAAWTESNETIEFSLAVDPSESGTLLPDSYGVSDQITVKTIGLHDLAPIDFLKIEAEGNEPEVLAGLEPGDAEKIVVNCDAEREGESPAINIRQTLEDWGYDVHHRIGEVGTCENSIFARYT